MAIYVVSDLHGYYNLFLKGIEKIKFSDDDMLWVLGDAIDRGPDGIRLLRHIKRHKNMDLIIGNHEYMMLNSVDPDGGPECNGKDADLWLYGNSGVITLRDYLDLSSGERSDLLNWLKERYVIRTISLNGKDYCLTHSFYKESCENKRYSEIDEKDVWSITWSSIWRDDDATKAENIYTNYGYTFICGHVPVHLIRRWQEKVVRWNVLKPFKKDNIVNIDGGCAYGYDRGIRNGAIFLRLDDMKAYTVRMGY